MSDQDDMVARLRKVHLAPPIRRQISEGRLVNDAADEIERLRARLAELEAERAPAP